MDKKAEPHFNEILKLAQKRLDEVRISTYEIFPSYAVLRFKGRLGKHTLRVTEILEKKKRKYSYYFLLKNRVIVGYDNAADPRAIKLKWGKNYLSHLNKAIPHRHSEGKKELALTEDMFFENALNEFLTVQSF